MFEWYMCDDVCSEFGWISCFGFVYITHVIINYCEPLLWSIILCSDIFKLYTLSMYCLIRASMHKSPYSHKRFSHEKVFWILFWKEWLLTRPQCYDENILLEGTPLSTLEWPNYKWYSWVDKDQSTDFELILFKGC